MSGIHSPGNSSKIPFISFFFSGKCLSGMKTIRPPGGKGSQPCFIYSNKLKQNRTNGCENLKIPRIFNVFQSDKMNKSRSKSILFLKILRIFSSLAGLFFLLCILLAFTTLPFRGIHWLGTSKSKLRWEPKTIILLGGGGMPGESNLMRCWYTGAAARKFPAASIAIAMPGSIADSTGTPQRIKEELVLRGANPSRIIFENQGTNTRSQALQCKNLFNPEEAVLLVTSPAHTRRAILAFRKAGFEKINALPAFENAAEADLSFRDQELGGNVQRIPGIGENLSVRYQIWSHLKYEVIIARELLALGYYRLKGWI